MFDSFRKKREILEKKKKQIFLNPVFMKFLDHSKKFPELSFSENLNSKELEEAFKTKKSRLHKIRGELNEIAELNELEIVTIWNLMPNNIEEAVSWIPSLERLKISGKENKIKEAIDIIQKNSPLENGN